MAQAGRKRLNSIEREAICFQVKDAVREYGDAHPDMTKEQIAKTMLGISPQHLTTIERAKTAPNDEVLSRAAHFFNKNFVFRGQEFTPNSFNPPTSPADGQEYSRQLTLKFEEPIRLSGAEATMRVVQQAGNHWTLEIWLEKAKPVGSLPGPFGAGNYTLDPLTNTGALVQEEPE